MKMRIRFYSIVTAAAVLAMLSMNTVLDAAQAGQQQGGGAAAAPGGQGGGGQRGAQAQANQPPAGQSRAWPMANRI
jgi:hypothetical protein